MLGGSEFGCRNQAPKPGYGIEGRAGRPSAPPFSRARVTGLSPTLTCGMSAKETRRAVTRVGEEVPQPNVMSKPDKTDKKLCSEVTVMATPAAETRSICSISAPLWIFGVEARAPSPRRCLPVSRPRLQPCRLTWWQWWQRQVADRSGNRSGNRSGAGLRTGAPPKQTRRTTALSCDHGARDSLRTRGGHP